MSEKCFEQLRVLHDEKHKNYFDRLRLSMQKERTKINSAPVVKKYEAKGNINHEPPIRTVKPVNYHEIALNHSTITRNNI